MQEWDMATAENFNLNSPMEVNWGYMEPSLFTKFWESSPERRAIRATLPDCMAVCVQCCACAHVPLRESQQLLLPMPLLLQGIAVAAILSSPAPPTFCVVLLCCKQWSGRFHANSSMHLAIKCVPLAAAILPPQSPLQDRILVFHRGMGTERLKGLLIDQKLDLLMDYTVFHVLEMVSNMHTERRALRTERSAECASMSLLYTRTRTCPQAQEPLKKAMQQAKEKLMKLLKRAPPAPAAPSAPAGSRENSSSAAAAAAAAAPSSAGGSMIQGDVMVGSTHKFARVGAGLLPLHSTHARTCAAHLQSPYESNLSQLI